ncbi:MAG: hypothetical protein LBI75_00245 [Brucellaceae bacterium]|nr:hypothetical protein [Brucellaceae bacterium]
MMPLNMSRSALAKTLALTAVIAPLWAGTAMAWTGDDVAKRVQALLKEQMIELTYSKVDTKDQTVVLQDAKARVVVGKDLDSDETSPVNLGTITLSGISEIDGDVYLIEKASFDDVKIVEDSSVFTTSDIRFDKVKLTKDPKTDLIGRMQYAESFHVGALTLTNGGKKIFELSDLNLSQEPYSKEKPSNYSWGFKALTLDLEEINRIDQEKKKKQAEEVAKATEEAAQAAAEAAEAAAEEATKHLNKKHDDATADSDAAKAAATDIEEDENEVTADGADASTDEDIADEDTIAEAQDDFDMAAIRALGLEKIHLTMEAKGSWSPYSGAYVIDNMTLNGQNIGTYSYKLSMGGYDMKFIKAVQDLFNNVLEDGGDNTSMQIAAVGMMQNLSIKHMEMRYDDADFFGKVLDYQAKERGITREELVKEMKDQLQFGVLYFDNEPRVVEAVKALGEYLDAPKSLSLKVQPENPVTFGILTAVGMAEPKKLWSVLGVTVEANK